MNLNLQRHRISSIAAVLLGVVANLALADSDPAMPHMPGMKAAHTMHPAPQSQSFLVNNSKPFAELMGQAMSVMDGAMTQAPMNGDPDHDFASMMIPHHQGAVDMAKVELLYGKDPVLRRLAQEIIVTQDSEIQVMQSQIKKLRGADALPPPKSQGGTP